MRTRSAPPEPCWTGEAPVAPASGTIQMCGVFLFAARSTSTALNKTHLPSGEGTGSPTRFSFIMSSKVKGCLAWAAAGRVRQNISRNERRRMHTSGRRLSSLLPGIDQTHAATLEIRCISGCQGSAIRFRDCRNLRIQDRGWSSPQATASGNRGERSRRGTIENKNPLSKEGGKHRLSGRRQSRAALPEWKDLKSV